MDIHKVCLAVLLCLGSTSSQQSNTCPTALGWYAFKDKCYKLYPFPKSTKADAAQICEVDGGSLLSVNTLAEHEFVNAFLIEHDPKRTNWLTSGTLMNTGVRWSGDNSLSPTVELSKWMAGLMEGGLIVPGVLVSYMYSGSEYLWGPGKLTTSYSFICETKLEDVYKIVQQYRGFDYGLNVDSVELAWRGPTFALQPMDTVILGKSVVQVHMDCVANGNPEPSYEWWFASQAGQPYTQLLSSDRLTFTTGRLSIDMPKQIDSGYYQCLAKNSNGTSLSNPVSLSFGDLGAFSNVAPAPVNAREYAGAQIECPNIEGKPAVSYTWYKNDFSSFIRPNFQKHTFISASGKLLFSELAESDDAEYFCVASLTSFGAPGNYEGAYQTATRTSLGFKLNVNTGTSSNYQPEIQNGFISFYPSSPMRGGPVRIECFAYGTLPLSYAWSRKSHEGVAMDLPPGHRYDSNMRILELDNVMPEDGGDYTCKVFSQKTNINKETTATLLIQSKPYFTYNLTHQHRDVREKLIWQCEAGGVPTPVYSWYKDGQVLSSSPGVTVNENTLIIDSLEKARDSAMYQCGASNSHGKTFSTAQLRVLEIAPNFLKSPMRKSTTSALQGNVTILCNPTAAPKPSFVWLKDGSPLGLTAGDYFEDDHRKLLLNGNLMITSVTQSDQGRYTCRVENTLGTAEDYSDLVTMESTVISNAPSDNKVEVGFTATLLCEASAMRNIDMIYSWRFNDHIIDFFRESATYQQGTGTYRGYLYIKGIKFIHEGEYTCVVNTAMDSASASAYITVLGPPSEAAGVSVRGQPLSNLDPQSGVNPSVNMDTTRWLVWTDGDSNGAPITKYRIQFRTDFDQEWRLHPDGNMLETSRTISDSYPGLHFAQLTNLKAGAGVEFRVQAINVFGAGTFSLATTMVQIPGAAPSQLVMNVRGGQGSVGDLAMEWDPLSIEDHNGANLNLRYTVFWRPYVEGRTEREDNWRSAEIEHDKACMFEPDNRKGLVFRCKYVELLGADFYFMPYETKVQAFNNKGDGPTTVPVVVMSAEELPLQAPTEVYAKAFNATALRVTWKSIPNNRVSARGVLAGYKINYWNKYKDEETDALQNIIELPTGATNLEYGLIIGLNATLWYEFNVQAYNSAGNGPKSSDYEQQTFNKVPEKYPTEVHVYSVQGMGIRVTFRGISTQYREEPLIGYKVQVWESQENILAARLIDFGKMTTGVIRNLTSSKIYNLRIYGYSRAGQGKRSSPNVFFTVGEGQIQINRETMAIMNRGFTTSPSFLITLTTIVICLLNNLFS